MSPCRALAMEIGGRRKDLGPTTADAWCYGNSATAPGSGLKTRVWLWTETESPSQTNHQIGVLRVKHWGHHFTTAALATYQAYSLLFDTTSRSCRSEADTEGSYHVCVISCGKWTHNYTDIRVILQLNISSLSRSPFGLDNNTHDTLHRIVDT